MFLIKEWAMKRLVLMGVLGLSITSQAENLYAYKQGDNQQLFLTNIKDKTDQNPTTILVPHQPSFRTIKQLPITSITVPTSQGLDTVVVKPKIATSPNEGITLSQSSIDDETDYDSPDKRWIEYNEWKYRKIENDFNNLVIKAAELPSNDGNATLAILYDAKDKKYQNPEVGIMLSGDYDGENWHNFLCKSDCLNVDFNVDGKKYPNISMKYGGKRFLTAKNPKALLDKIKTGETIKVRILSVTGDYIIYYFEPETVLDLKKLRSL